MEGGCERWREGVRERGRKGVRSDLAIVHLLVNVYFQSNRIFPSFVGNPLI